MSKLNWSGRQKESVRELNVWETLFEFSDVITVTWTIDPITNVPTPCYKTNNNSKRYAYLKQIYIHNLDSEGENNKKFSIRIFNSTAVSYNIIEDCQVEQIIAPSEMIIADKITLTNGQRIAVLGIESPLKLDVNDKIQIQANTEIDGWIISAWIEEEKIEDQAVTSFSEGTGVVNEISNMAGLSRKIMGNTRTIKTNFKK